MMRQVTEAGRRDDSRWQVAIPDPTAASLPQAPKGGGAETIGAAIKEISGWMAAGCARPTGPHGAREVFLRRVAGDGAVYLCDTESFSSCVAALLERPEILDALRANGHSRFRSVFTWPDVLAQYEALLFQHLPAPSLIE